MVDLARINWLSSIDDGSSEQKQFALEKIYDDYVKIEIARCQLLVHQDLFSIPSTKDKTKVLLENERIRMKNKIYMSRLIYGLHGSDCYEEIFRDNVPALQEELDGIDVAIEELDSIYDENDEKEGSS